LKVGEKWTRYGGTDAWPEWEVSPTTAWNYGLVLNGRNPAKAFEVVKVSNAAAANPFTPETAPIQLRTKAQKIPVWKVDALGLVGKLQASPLKSDAPTDTITLIPMGAARLRISSFPVISADKNAHEWTEPTIR
jgi:hypothetical protein